MLFIYKCINLLYNVDQLMKWSLLMFHLNELDKHIRTFIFWKYNSCHHSQKITRKIGCLCFVLFQFSKSEKFRNLWKQVYSNLWSCGLLPNHEKTTSVIALIIICLHFNKQDGWFVLNSLKCFFLNKHCLYVVLNSQRQNAKKIDVWK